MLAVAAPSIVIPSPARADFTSSWSVGYQVWAAPYWGVGLQREEPNIAGIPYDGVCSVAYEGLMVRQIEVMILQGSGNALEFMTVHKCAGVQFWLAGYYYNGVWYPLALVDGPNYQTHDFFIYRVGSLPNSWMAFQIDQTLLTGVQWSTTGTSIHAGLHTFTDTAVEPSHTYRSLVRLIPSGGWTGWTSPVFGNVTTPLMCGGFWGPTIWRASVNAPC